MVAEGTDWFDLTLILHFFVPKNVQLLFNKGHKHCKKHVFYLQKTLQNHLRHIYLSQIVTCLSYQPYPSI